MWVIVSIQKPSHHILQTILPLRMFKVVFRDSSLYSKPLSLYCLSSAYARVVGGVNPLKFDMLQEVYYLRKGD